MAAARHAARLHRGDQGARRRARASPTTTSTRRPPARRCAASSAASATSSTTSRAPRSGSPTRGRRASRSSRSPPTTTRSASRTGPTPITGADALKAQHPEFEMWNQGIHARSGVACADCHMPYKRVGALKISDHHVRWPLLNINNACQTCHKWPEEELLARVETIQAAHLRPAQPGDGRAGRADRRHRRRAQGRGAGRRPRGARARRSAAASSTSTSSRAENSTGFHAPQEAARILGDAIDLFRQGQMSLRPLKWGAPVAPGNRAAAGGRPRRLRGRASRGGRPYRHRTAERGSDEVRVQAEGGPPVRARMLATGTALASVWGLTPGGGQGIGPCSFSEWRARLRISRRAPTRPQGR